MDLAGGKLRIAIPHAALAVLEGPDTRQQANDRGQKTSSLQGTLHCISLTGLAQNGVSEVGLAEVTCCEWGPTLCERRKGWATRVENTSG